MGNAANWKWRKAIFAGVAVVAAMALFQWNDYRGTVQVMEEANAASKNNRPHTNGKHFATLDAYLEHRRRLGAIDLPWYREVQDGIYELQTAPLPLKPAKTRFTRQELLKKYGFER